MAIALVTQTTASGTGFSNPTSGNVNMTGATLFVAVGTSGNSGTMSFSDSSSNTWQKLTSQTVNTNWTQMAYVFNPTVTSTQNFTLGGAQFPYLIVYGFSGTNTTSSVFDQQSGAGSHTPGTLTPAQSGELFVTACGNNGGNNTATISDTGSLFVNGDITQNGNSSFEILAAAWHVNSGSGAVNPTWSMSNGAGGPSVMACFLPAAAAAVNHNFLMMMGAGT